MAIVLTNTLTGRKETLTPREPGHVRLYWCGVTVYSRAHVGHARFLVVADLLFRHLRARGLRVTYVRNFTDVDDKIIRRAADEGLTPTALAEREIAAFQQDLTPLACLPPTHEPRATAHIGLMVALIEQLVAKGMAYPVPGGSVYFRVRRFSDYGKLSHRRLDDMEVGEEIDPHKDDPHDFALWKGSKPGEPTWDSPWGPGRPGWHIECSAMAAHYLGQPFDLHGGGTDLVFPHHENELAQSEAATGTAFADLWVHNGMITFGADKMSKSLGNVLSIAEATKRAPGEALRLLFLGTHYRTPLDFSAGRLEEATRSLERLYETLARVEQATGEPAAPVPVDGALVEPSSPFLADFVEAMDDDLNAARALGIVFDRVRELNRALDAGDLTTVRALRADLARVAAVLGVLASVRPPCWTISAPAGGRARASRTPRSRLPSRPATRRASARTSARRTPSARV